jgi:hypothetical protein
MRFLQETGFFTTPCLFFWFPVRQAEIAAASIAGELLILRFVDKYCVWDREGGGKWQ